MKTDASYKKKLVCMKNCRQGSRGVSKKPQKIQTSFMDDPILMILTFIRWINIASLSLISTIKNGIYIALALSKWTLSFNSELPWTLLLQSIFHNHPIRNSQVYMHHTLPNSWFIISKIFFFHHIRLEPLSALEHWNMWSNYYIFKNTNTFFMYIDRDIYKGAGGDAMIFDYNKITRIF